MNSSILINKLVVVGIRKNYTVNFYPGVNIIYGDSATGKSSVLNLIDYLLGAKKFNSYSEIEAVGRYAVLDVMLNDIRYTIKRDIFDASKLIEVYQCSFEEVEEYSCKKYIPTYKRSSLSDEYGFFSEFILTALNIANVKLKNSPSQDDSSLSRLSFRDLFKYCYVDQDDLGSKNFLDRGNYVLEEKNAQVFKYIFNALDSQISDVLQEISIKSKDKSKFDKKFRSVSEFLRESDFGSMECIDKEILIIDDDISIIKKQIEKINNKATADNEVYRAVKTALEELELEFKIKGGLILNCESKIEKFTRLKNDYLLDIKKFKSSQEALEIIGKISQDLCLCPVCDNSISISSIKDSFEISNKDKIKYEINSLKRRVKDVDVLISEERQTWELESVRLKDLTNKINKARVIFDLHAKDLVSPYISERDMFVQNLATIKQKRTDLISRLKLRNQHNLIDKNIGSLEIDIKNLQDKLDKLTAEAPSLESISSSMTDFLKLFLNYVNIKDPRGVSLSDRKFFPIVRDTDYQNITSGGLRTITCIGYLCAFLQESLKTDMNYPSFLMIDTVGKYLGKTKSKYNNETSIIADKSEGVSDPDKYQNIYEYMIKLTGKFENENKNCQIILVDNDVPPYIVEDLSGFIVAHYSSDPSSGLPIGFIDDADINN